MNIEYRTAEVRKTLRHLTFLVRYSAVQNTLVMLNLLKNKCYKIQEDNEL